MSAGKKLIEAAAGVGGGGVSDDDFANVVLLLDGDGTSGDDNNTFTDSSTNALTITESGSVVQGSFSPYGDNWSNYFNSADERLDFSPSFSLGSNNFTIEMWVNPSALTATSLQTFFWLESGTNDFIALRVNNNGNAGFEFRVYNGSNKVLITQGSNYLENGEWVHVAATKSGSTYNFFVNGTSVGTATYATALTSYTNGHIGAWTSVSQDYAGYVSNVRVINGTALYTSNFTPPTGYLTAVTNTVLLTCQSNRFVDNASSPHTLTLGVTPKVTPFSPFKDDDARDITTDVGSAYLNDDAYTALSAGDGNILPATDDFTIEGWVYHTGINSTSSNRSGFFIKDKGSNRDVNDGVFRSHFNNDGTTINNFSATLFKDGVNQGVGTTWTYTFNLFEWYHVALVRYGSTVELFINGESQGTGTGVTTLEQNTDRTNYIASWRSDKRDELVGYISDFRIVSSQVYTTDFTPPTSPLTAIANTELLLNFQDAGIYDRSGLNNIDTVGNAQIDTAVKKYGTGSLEFDGTGDGLSSPETTSFGFGSGDFTIEAWAYLTTNGVFNNIVSAGVDSSNGYRLDISTTNKLRFLAHIGSWATVITGSTSLATGQWYHLAVTRNGNNFDLWVDGSSDATTVSNSGAITDPTTKIEVGAVTTGALNRSFNGYLDDVRVTKGVARYTSNFTPPTAALPKF